MRYKESLNTQNPNLIIGANQLIREFKQTDQFVHLSSCSAFYPCLARHLINHSRTLTLIITLSCKSFQSQTKWFNFGAWTKENYLQVHTFIMKSTINCWRHELKQLMLLLQRILCFIICLFFLWESYFPP